jgi:hypothetical protein
VRKVYDWGNSFVFLLVMYGVVCIRLWDCGVLGGGEVIPLCGKLQAVLGGIFFKKGMVAVYIHPIQFVSRYLVARISRSSCSRSRTTSMVDMSFSVSPFSYTFTSRSLNSPCWSCFCDSIVQSPLLIFVKPHMSVCTCSYSTLFSEILQYLSKFP